MQPSPAGGRAELSSQAAQQTPAAAAWGEVSLTTNSLARESTAAIESLVGALQSAADAYLISDQSAAASLGGGA